MTAQPHRPAMQQPNLTDGSAARQLTPAAPWRPAAPSVPHGPNQAGAEPDEKPTAQDEAATPAPAEPEFDPAELTGGSIPAPQLQTPGR